MNGEFNIHSVFYGEARGDLVNSYLEGGDPHMA
jgi:hypothetical protein